MLSRQMAQPACISVSCLSLVTGHAHPPKPLLRPPTGVRQPLKNLLISPAVLSRLLRLRWRNCLPVGLVRAALGLGLGRDTARALLEGRSAQPLLCLLWLLGFLVQVMMQQQFKQPFWIWSEALACLSGQGLGMQRKVNRRLLWSRATFSTALSSTTSVMSTLYRTVPFVQHSAPSHTMLAATGQSANCACCNNMPGRAVLVRTPTSLLCQHQQRM